tara:strand:- start:7946 stop:8455 length:510 start_codon:yes stop_codon:yes gene_type:complete
MKVKTDDTAWSGYDPSKGPPILKAVDKEVKDTVTSNVNEKIGEAERARDVALVELAQRLDELATQKDLVDQELAQVEGQIAHYFPEEAGELAKSTGEYDIIVTRSERWTWDKASLEKHFGENKLPDYINRSLTVDKRKFQKLTKTEQEELKFALTRHLNSPKVKVVKHV